LTDSPNLRRALKREEAEAMLLTSELDQTEMKEPMLLQRPLTRRRRAKLATACAVGAS
jgi:hypothetical protein